jgi:AbrB family looped-hinge helix DNA binding protein
MRRNAITSTISSKGQTTLPVKVRKALGVESGDVILYEIEEEQVRIRKARPLDLSWARALESTLGEWNDPDDDDL